MAIDPNFQCMSRYAGVAIMAGLAAACSAVPPPQPRPMPVPVPAPIPIPRPAPAPGPADWRDVAQTAGDWTWRMAGGNSQAVFGLSGAPVAMLVCDSASRSLVLSRAGDGTASLPMTVRTTFGLRPLSSDPASGRPGWIAVRLQLRDVLLDQMAFSRGRFTIEVAGLPTLYLPSWPEISRVIEDCR